MEKFDIRSDVYMKQIKDLLVKSDVSEIVNFHNEHPKFDRDILLRIIDEKMGEKPKKTRSEMILDGDISPPP